MQSTVKPTLVSMEIGSKISQTRNFILDRGTRSRLVKCIIAICCCTKKSESMSISAMVADLKTTELSQTYIHLHSAHVSDIMNVTAL
jgi:hypothetical protein